MGTELPLPGEGAGGLSVPDDQYPALGLTIKAAESALSLDGQKTSHASDANEVGHALSNREFRETIAGSTGKRRASIYLEDHHESVRTGQGNATEQRKSSWKEKIGWAPGKRDWTTNDQKVWRGDDERRKRSGSMGSSFKGLSESMRRRLSSSVADDPPSPSPSVSSSGVSAKVTPASDALVNGALPSDNTVRRRLLAHNFHPETRESLNLVLSNTYISAFITLCTFYALFANDLRLLLAPPAVDDFFTTITVAVMIIFFIELVALSIAKPGYFGGLFFWLDLFAALSMLTEVPEVAIQLQGGASDSEEASIFRASRAAKAGTKIGRLLKLARLIRVAKLYTRRRLNTSRWTKSKTQTSDVARRERRDSLLGTVGDDSIWEDEMHAGDIAHELSEQTTTKVVIGVLFMLVVLQLIQPSPPTNLESGRYEGLRHIGLSNMETGINSHWNSQAQCSNIAVTLKTAPSSPLLYYPPFKQVGQRIIHNEMDTERFSRLRTGPRSAHETETFTFTWAPDNVVVSSAKWNTTRAIAVFDDRETAYEEALSSLLMTCFIIFVLGVGSVSFSRDARTFAEKIAEPLRALEYDMSLVSKMKLNNDVQHPSSDLYEVRKIQQSFEILRASLQSFSKYVPAKVVRLLMSQGREAKLGVDPRTITILFSDIAGFTTMCETMAPKDLLVLISDYFEVMSAVVEARRGTLGEFIGDAILAFWNAPESVPEHAAECVRTALLMHSKLETLRSTWRERGYPDVRIRIGVHTARVFVGNLGARSRMKYGILGDGVNLASRLEELNKRYNTQLLLSEDTYKAITPYLPNLKPHLESLTEDEETGLISLNEDVISDIENELDNVHGLTNENFRTATAKRESLGSKGPMARTSLTNAGEDSPLSAVNKRNLPVPKAVMIGRRASAMAPYAPGWVADHPEFLCRPVDAVVVKGRSKATPVYEVMNIDKKPDDKLLLTVAAHHTKAVGCYFKRDFNGCMKHLRKVMNLRPDVQDTAAQVLYERAVVLAENPPGEDWNGVDVLTEKHFDIPTEISNSIAKDKQV